MPSSWILGDYGLEMQFGDVTNAQTDLSSVCFCPQPSLQTRVTPDWSLYGRGLGGRSWVLLLLHKPHHPYSAVSSTCSSTWIETCSCPRNSAASACNVRSLTQLHSSPPSPCGLRLVRVGACQLAGWHTLRLLPPRLTPHVMPPPRWPVFDIFNAKPFFQFLYC